MYNSRRLPVLSPISDFALAAEGRGIMQVRRQDATNTETGDWPYRALAREDRCAPSDTLSTAESEISPISAKGWILLFVLVAAVFLAYQPAWHGGLIWDDDQHVTPPELRSWHGLYRIWFDVGRHAAILSHFAQCLLARTPALGRCDARLSPGKSLLHCHGGPAGAVGAAAAEDSRGLSGGGDLRPASGACGIRGLDQRTEEHPFGRLLLECLLAYLHFDETRRPGWYFGALGLFVLAVLSKTVTATLPGALLVIFWWQRGRLNWKKDVLPLLPFFILGAGGGLITALWELHINNCTGPEFAFSLWIGC